MRLNKREKLKTLVQEAYEKKASHFDATRSKMATADFLWATNKIFKHDQVLDVGCGNGRLLDYILVPAENYLGIDNSLSLLKIAKLKYPDFSFQKQDINNLNDLFQNKFSVIFCSAVMIHVPGRQNRIKILSQLLSATKLDGKLIISAWKMTGNYYLKLKIKSIVKNFLLFRFKAWRDLVFPWKDQDGVQVCLRYYHYFSKRSFKKEILKAGWQIQEELDDRHNFWVLAVKKENNNL